MVRVTAAISPRVSVAALLATRPGHRPRLIYRTHRGRRGSRRKGFTEADYARLLDAAHQQLGGPIVGVWDNLSTHASKAMAELIAARPWLTVYRLPPYAHELNPVEPVWSHLKRSLANPTKHTITELTALVKTRLRRSSVHGGWSPNRRRKRTAGLAGASLLVSPSTTRGAGRGHRPTASCGAAETPRRAEPFTAVRGSTFLQFTRIRNCDGPQ